MYEQLKHLYLKKINIFKFLTGNIINYYIRYISVQRCVCYIVVLLEFRELPS